MRWRWQVDRQWDELDELPSPLGFLFGSLLAYSTIGYLILFLFILGVAIACLVVGTTLARGVGAILLAACVLVTVDFLRAHLTTRDL